MRPSQFSSPLNEAKKPRPSEPRLPQGPFPRTRAPASTGSRGFARPPPEGTRPTPARDIRRLSITPLTVPTPQSPAQDDSILPPDRPGCNAPRHGQIAPATFRTNRQSLPTPRTELNCAGARCRRRDAKTGWNHRQTNSLRIKTAMQTADESGRPRPPPTTNRPGPGHRHAPQAWTAPSPAAPPQKRRCNAPNTPVPPLESKAERINHK